MAQLYRFAEFGRLSAGLFHDLINPLSAVSLNMQKVKSSQNQGNEIAETKIYLDNAIAAAKRMEDFVIAVRKQLSRQESQEFFFLKEEIKHAIAVLSHKAQKAGVAIRFLSESDVKIFGDAIKFNQVILNLIANAIESYPEARANSSLCEVIIDLHEENEQVFISVADTGRGIAEGNQEKIFEPFFTTKQASQGVGIGLSMVKRIVEKDFGGSVDVADNQGHGTVFTIKFPKQKNV